MSQYKVHIVLFFVTLIYAVTFTAAKDVMPVYLGSQAFVFFRIAGALVLFWLLTPWEQKFFPSDKLRKVERKDILPLFVASIFGVAFNMSMFFKGLELTTPINGAVLMLNTPVFVLLLARFMGREYLDRKKVFGILLAAVGALLLMSGKEVSFSSQTLVGDVFITVNAIFYAFYLVYVRKLLAKYTVVTVSKWTFLFGLILILPLAYPQLQGVDFFAFPGFIVAEIIFIVVGTTFLAYLLNSWAIEKAGAVIVGSYIYLQPLLAGMIAVLLGSDEFTWLKLFAGLTVLTGVFLTSDKQQEILKKQLDKLKSK